MSCFSTLQKMIPPSWSTLWCQWVRYPLKVAAPDKLTSDDYVFTKNTCSLQTVYNWSQTGCMFLAKKENGLNVSQRKCWFEPEFQLCIHYKHVHPCLLAAKYHTETGMSNLPIFSNCSLSIPYRPSFCGHWTPNCWQFKRIALSEFSQKMEPYFQIIHDAQKLAAWQNLCTCFIRV